MERKHYTVGNLRSILREASEFSPKLGKNVTKDNDKNNKESYSQIEKQTKSYDGGARNEKKNINYPVDDNRGQECLEYNNMNDQFKKRVKSQLKGYTSDEAEKLHKNDDYGNADFNELNGIKDKAKVIKKARAISKGLGISGKQENKLTTKDYENQRELAVEHKITKLKFKNTKFITEKYMMSRIPDSFKKDGNKFLMEDKHNQQYLIEWHEEAEPFVMNKTKLNEQQHRIKELFDYKSGDSKTTNTMRLKEDKNINSMISKARKLM